MSVSSARLMYVVYSLEIVMGKATVVSFLSEPLDNLIRLLVYVHS